MYDYGMYNATDVAWAHTVLTICYLVFAVLGIILFLKIWQATNRIKSIMQHISEINERQEKVEKSNQPEENTTPLKYAVKEEESDGTFPDGAALFAWIAFIGILIATIAIIIEG